MARFKVTYIRKVEEIHSVYVDADNREEVDEMYENGEIPEDDSPSASIIDEHSFKIEEA